MRKLDEYHFIDSRDFLLLPIYFLVIYIFSLVIIKKTGEKDLALFKKVLVFKLILGVIYGLVYQYFYGGGDTSVYFITGKNILENENMNFTKILKLIFLPFSSTEDIRNQLNNVAADFTGIGPNYFPVRLTTLFGMLSCKTYLNICMFFSALSLIGIWRNFKVFCEIYPQLRKQFIWAFLFLPSIIFWSSGINKDTLCFGAFALFTSYYLQIVMLKKISLKNHLMMFLCFLLVNAIKPYIVYSFLPLGILFYFKEVIIKNIRNVAMRKVTIGLCVSAFLLFLTSQIEWINENIINTVINNLLLDFLNMNTYLQGMEGASNYDIGLSKIDPSNVSPFLFLEKLPICFTTTMFRPFVFETRNPFMLLSALEGLFTLLLLLYALFTTKIIGLFKILWQNTVVTLFMFYSILFSFFIGLTANNFGTLVRYKIPCFSYFIACLFIIIYLSKQQNKLDSIMKEK